MQLLLAILIRHQVIVLSFLGENSIIVGGYGNTTSNFSTSIGGGAYNTASNNSATVGGGWTNTASGPSATIGGGQFNVASANSATVGGGLRNTALNNASTVGGGLENIASGQYAALTGGRRDSATGQYSFVGGGRQNTASNSYATVVNGLSNKSSGSYATILGGNNNAAIGNYSLLFGVNNQASSYGETVLGVYATEYTASSTTTFSTTDRLFNIGNGSSTTARSDAFTILKNGNTGIGTSTPSAKLEVASNRILVTNSSDAIYCSQNSTNGNRFELIGSYPGWDASAIYLGGYNVNNIGSPAYSNANKIYCGGSIGSLPIHATAFNISSSATLKQNISTLTYGLKEIMQIRPVTYQYNFDQSGLYKVGFIAEEVSNIIPELVAHHDDQGNIVSKEKGKPVAMDYSQMTAVLVNAIQEQQAQIEELKAKIKALETAK